MRFDDVPSIIAAKLSASAPRWPYSIIRVGPPVVGAITSYLRADPARSSAEDEPVPMAENPVRHTLWSTRRRQVVRRKKIAFFPISAPRARPPIWSAGGGGCFRASNPPFQRGPDLVAHPFCSGSLEVHAQTPSRTAIRL